MGTGHGARLQSRSARRLGVTRGQPLGTAHRLVAGGAVPGRPIARRTDARWRPRSTRWPSSRRRSRRSIAPEARTFGQVLLGIEGLHRLWGDEPTLTGASARGRVRRCFPDSRGWASATRASARRSRRSSAAAGSRQSPSATARPKRPISRHSRSGCCPRTTETHERLRIFGLTRIGEFAACRDRRSSPASARTAACSTTWRGAWTAAAAATQAGRAAARRGGARATGRQRSSRCASCCATCAARCASSSRRAAPARPGQCSCSTWSRRPRSRSSSSCPSRPPPRTCSSASSSRA